MKDDFGRMDAAWMKRGAVAVILAGTVFGVPASADGAVRPSVADEVRSIETARLGVPRPASIELAAGGRALRVAGGGRGRRIRVTTERSLGRAPARTSERRSASAFGARLVLNRRRQAIIRVDGGARRTLVALRGRTPERWRAIAFNRADRLVYVLGRRTLLGFDARGRHMHTVDLRPLGIEDAGGLAFARTGDPTDDPALRHLYVADRGGAGAASGRVVEARVEAVGAVAAAVTEVKARHVQMISTAVFSPSSPDPSGIAYVGGGDRFIISDSEVEEVAIWRGVNLFSTVRGALTGTGLGTTYPYNKEPTGLGYDPATQTLYASDDDGDRVSVIRPGPDGRHGTADDTWTRFSTAAFDSYDAEGVEYDPATGNVFICDGSGLEIFRVDPVNGVFGDAGDRVTHFDLAVYGQKDCEGLGIDARRGTLLAVDPSRRKLLELSKGGDLVSVIDLSALPASIRSTAGLASVTMAPTSDPTDDPSVMDYWMADRQVDNGADPNENDGLIHEFSVPIAPPADAPPTATITRPAAGAGVSGVVAVQANATDDSGVVASVQVRVDGVTVGTDADGGDGWAVDWDSRNVANGGHAITVIAKDGAGNLGASAPVQVVVQNGGALSVPVRAGSDDASELQNGQVNRTTGDLELGTDLGTPTTTGVRFSGLTIPRGSRITKATVQFNADELDRQAASLTVRAQAADSALAFTSTAFNVSSRPRTAASVAWSPPTWTVFGAAGAEQRTPDLRALLQAVVDRPGWASGNAVAFIVTGTGRRTAESFEGGIPPVLDVEFLAP